MLKNFLEACQWKFHKQFMKASSPQCVHDTSSNAVCLEIYEVRRTSIVFKMENSTVMDAQRAIDWFPKVTTAVVNVNFVV